MSDSVDTQHRPSFTVETLPGELSIVGVTDEGLGNTAWLASVDGHVLIVDPERDPQPYLSAMEALPARRDSDLLVAETHLHADFLSGARQLSGEGATAIAPAGAHSTWPHQAVHPNETLDLGRFRLEVLPTPGHTPEHVSYVLSDGGRPVAVFTGGSLLVGAVARTDLIDPADTEELTRALFHSINRDLLSLPDDVVVLPTHGAGSFCSAAGGSRRWTTIGHERRMNPLLHLDEDAFVRAVLDPLGTYPRYFLHLRERNRVGPRVYDAFPLLDELTAERVLDLRERGATIVDVRPVADYAAGHIGGSLANTLRPQFASWLGWLVEDSAAPLIFVTDRHTDRAELVRQCLNIGYENLAGAITVDTWRAAGGDLRRTPLVTSDSSRHVIDVRQTNEYAGGHLPGATHVELGSLAEAHTALPRGPIVTMCGHGERAATAASLLEATGYGDVAIAAGGPGDWAARTGQTLQT